MKKHNYLSAAVSVPHYSKFKATFLSPTPPAYLPTSGDHAKATIVTNKFVTIKNKKGTTLQKKVVPFRWSRRESNPGPNISAISFLHVYSAINCRDKAGT